MLELKRRRDELLAALATAYGERRLPAPLYERLLAAALGAKRAVQLMRLSDTLAARLRQEAPAPPTGSPTIDGAIAAFHDAISWRGARRPSREALFALLSPRALLVDEAREHDREAFWSRVERWTVMTYFPFVQRELAAETSVYAGLAQRLSFFETTMVDDGSVIRRGLASFQLTLDGDRWLIRSVASTEEREGYPITTLSATRPP